MRWVDNKDYVGKDRRAKRPTLRLGERRQEDETREAPSVAAMIRQLRVRAVTATTPAGVQAFVKRARVLADYALSIDEAYVAETVQRLAANAEKQPETDWSSKLDKELGWLAERVGA